MLRRWLSSFLMPKLHWVQVEVTSHCNAACVYCPHTAYQSRWTSRHLSLTTFSKLLPSLARTSMVYLQGWGEPFLNPDFFKMVAMAKQAGCRVGTTTNGMLLNSETIMRLAESRMDLVAFSLAGTDGKNDACRQGTSLKQVLEAMQTLHRAQRKTGSIRAEDTCRLYAPALRGGGPGKVATAFPGFGCRSHGYKHPGFCAPGGARS